MYRDDEKQFFHTKAYPKIYGFLEDLNRSFRYRKIMSCFKVTQISNLLSEIQQKIESTPLRTDTMDRFANSAVKDVYEFIEGLELKCHCYECHDNEDFKNMNEYFRLSFGNKTRMDYGTGHEINFISFLYCVREYICPNDKNKRKDQSYKCNYCCWSPRENNNRPWPKQHPYSICCCADISSGESFSDFSDEKEDKAHGEVRNETNEKEENEVDNKEKNDNNGESERSDIHESEKEYDFSVALHPVIKKYFLIIRTLIQKYKLEPAGSNGVYAVDDYAFLPFLFGSTELIKSKNVGVYDFEGMSIEEVTNIWKNESDYYDEIGIRKKNMFRKALAFVHSQKCHTFNYSLKRHSPVLWSLKDLSFEEVNRIMMNEINEKVFGRSVVMQHFHFSSFLEEF